LHCGDVCWGFHFGVIFFLGLEIRGLV
jgi:hypothetical protein